MSQTPTTIDNLSEDEAATLILVDANDSPLGSASLSERLVLEDHATEHVIHRTCSLHIFWNDDPTGKGSSTSRILLSRLVPIVGDNYCDSSHTDENVFWTSSVQATPLFGMNPPEALISKGNKQDQLDTDVQGCRNALSRTLLIPEATSDNVVAPTNCDNTREKSPLLELLPSASEWIFIGRVLHMGKRKHSSRSNAPVKNENAQLLSKCSTLEYVFVCQLNTSLQDSNAQRLLSLKKCSIGGWESRLGEMTNECNLQLEWKWVSILDVRASLVDEKSNHLKLDEKFKAIANKVLNLQIESIPKKGFIKQAARQEGIYIVDDNTPTANSVQSLLGDDSKKQGAYGKIVTHKEPILSQLCHVDEVIAAILFLYLSPMRSNLKVKNDPDMAFCEEILVAVSRSFAAVIRQLPTEILKDVAIFYLVLRALDTVEDDMVAFESNDVKCQHLLSFHETALVDPSWSMDGVGHGDEKKLLQEFPAVHRVYKSLSIESQVIISDITARMAAGMAEFVGKDLGQGTIDVSEYNRYCHFVAGLVGEGLSRIFASSSFESDSLASQIFLSDQMGLFLQKTNIIRDFLEDYVDKRAFWPQSVWKKYSVTGELGYFCNVEESNETKKAALSCLNELVADALELIPDCLSYMACLQCTEIFRFCAIPQVMALSTLEKLYNNPSVFTGVVKIRKGLACKLMQKSSTLMDLHEIFYTFSERILIRCKCETEESDNPVVYARTIAACEKAMELTYNRAALQRRNRFVRFTIAVFTIALVSLFWRQTLSLDFARAAVVILISILYWFGSGTTLRARLKPANRLKGGSVV